MGALMHRRTHLLRVVAEVEWYHPVCRHFTGSVIDSCHPPFGQTPDCFSSLGNRIISSPACAEAYSRMFNVSAVATLINISSTAQAINTACSAITDEVRPENASVCLYLQRGKCVPISTSSPTRTPRGIPCSAAHIAQPALIGSRCT